MFEMVMPFIGMEEYNKVQLGFQDRSDDVVIESVVSDFNHLPNAFSPACLFREHRHFPLQDGMVPVWSKRGNYYLSSTAASKVFIPITFGFREKNLQVLEYADPDPETRARLLQIGTQIDAEAIGTMVKIAYDNKFEDVGIGVTFLPYFFTDGNADRLGQARFMEKELISADGVSATVVEEVDNLPADRAPTVWCPDNGQWLLVSGCGCAPVQSQDP